MLLSQDPHVHKSFFCGFCWLIQRNADSQACQYCDQKSDAGFFAVDQSCDSGNQHTYSFYVHDPSQYINNNRIIHFSVPFLRKNICDVTEAFVCSDNDNSVTDLNGILTTGDADNDRYG